MDTDNTYFSLNINVMKDIPIEKYVSDFTFIVDGKRYHTSRIIADILSPIVRKLHFSDESIDEFFIYTDFYNTESIVSNKSDSNTENSFQDFLNLCSFEKVELNSQNRELFSTYFYKLGNINEFLQIRPELFTSLTIENAIDRLQTINNLSKNNSEDFDRQSFDVQAMISFIASHFEDTDQKKLEDLPIELLEEVMNSEDLKITDEDSLFRFIMKLYETDNSYSILFEYILFNNLSVKSIEIFVRHFQLENLNKKIWETVCYRLMSQNNTKRYHNDVIRKIETGKGPQILKEFKYSMEKAFDGIMNFLTYETGSNIHNNGTIEITTNSIADDNASFHPKYLVDYKLLTFYESKNEEDIFICFDFKDKSIQLASYSIKSHNDGFNRGNLRNWIVEVSNDGKNWEEIDRHENDSTLNKSNFIANFVIKKKKDQFYRFIRFKQIGYSWYGYPNSNYYYLYFYFLEFFGKIKIPLIHSE